jgi:hypothetical protein
VYLSRPAFRSRPDNRSQDDRGAFWLCWYLIDVARSAHAAGRQEAAKEYREAFVDGRLKKRKLPARDDVKVWIEPKASDAA